MEIVPAILVLVWAQPQLAELAWASHSTCTL